MVVAYASFGSYMNDEARAILLSRPVLGQDLMR